MHLQELIAQKTLYKHHAFILLNKSFALRRLPLKTLFKIANEFCGINIPTDTKEIPENIYHPDLIIVDRERNILRLEDLEILKKVVLYPANIAMRRLFFIDNCDRLNKNAANALLKILEEPPIDVLYLFTCPDARRLMSTISSRCQKIPLQFAIEEKISLSDKIANKDRQIIVNYVSKLSELPFNAWFLKSPEIHAKKLAEILDLAQILGKKYESAILQEVIVVALRDLYLKNHKLGIHARHLMNFLNSWRDNEILNLNSAFWLTKLFIILNS